MPAEGATQKQLSSLRQPAGGFVLKRAVIFANGILENPPAVKTQLQPEDVIIAADGGAAHCRRLEVTPTVIVGDLDSLSAADVAYWQEQGVSFQRHDHRKDETDLELAFLYARQLELEEILVLGALGGRWDQTFANILLPGYHKLRGLPVKFWHNGVSIIPIEGTRTVRGKPGQTVSLIPIGGDAHGVRTEGLEWPLEGETLLLGATRGVSNVLQAERARIEVGEGMVLCFVFDPED
jgi:thiamine pyrophosphokinase